MSLLTNDVIVESPLDNVIATTEETVQRIIKSENKYRADAIALYMFYSYTGHWQAKGSKSTATRYNPQANNNYAMKCLGWGETRFRGAKKLLESLGLIEMRKKSYGTGSSTYVNVRYIHANVSTPPISTPRGTHPGGYSGQIQVTSKEIQDTGNKELAGSENPTPAGVERLENHSLKEKAKHNPLGAEIIKAFEEVDAKNKRYYNNTTQRTACDFLIEEYGLETVLSVIKILPKTNGQPYIPVITTPVQLRDKWTPLKNALIKKKAEQATRSVGRTVII